MILSQLIPNGEDLLKLEPEELDAPPVRFSRVGATLVGSGGFFRCEVLLLGLIYRDCPLDQSQDSS